MDMTAKKIGQLVALVLVSYGMTYGAVLFGVVSVIENTSGGGLSTFPLDIVNFDNGGEPVAVTSYTSPVLSDSGSYTFGSSTVSGSATAWATVNNGSLRGFASTTLSGFCLTCSPWTSNFSVFNPVWHDTIFISGLPNGTPVDLLLTSVMHSVESGSTVDLISDVSLGDQFVTLQNIDGISNGTLTQSLIVHTVAGATLALVNYVYGTVNIGANSNFESGTVDASDTANAYIKVLTAGAGYTSASGVSYAAPSAVPEPANWLFTGIALMAICSARRHRQ
jgi:hypothetical protein